MNKDEYVAGPHHFWTHFWCGIVFGSGVGAWISSGLFNNWLPFVASTIAIGLIVAFCCGRRGDSAWEFLLYFLLWTLG
jgi:hypothetical protein